MASGIGAADFLLDGDVLDPSVFGHVLHGLMTQKRGVSHVPWDRDIIPPARSPFMPPESAPLQPPIWRKPFQPGPPNFDEPGESPEEDEEADRYVDEQMIRMSLTELFKLIDQK